MTEVDWLGFTLNPNSVRVQEKKRIKLKMSLKYFLESAPTYRNL